jgi:hypothetical protein
MAKAPKYTKDIKRQIRERQGYNRMLQNKVLKPGQRQAARDFITAGKPKIKWK